MSVGRSHIDDGAARALRDHDLGRFLAQNEHRFQIDLQCALPRCRRMFQKRLENGDAGVVHQHVKLAPYPGAFEQRLAKRFVTNVTRQKLYFAISFQFAASVLAALARDVAGHHARALLKKIARDGLPDAASRASDNAVFILKT